jgi:hypothetical protein
MAANFWNGIISFFCQLGIVQLMQKDSVNRISTFGHALLNTLKGPKDFTKMSFGFGPLQRFDQLFLLVSNPYIFWKIFVFRATFGQNWAIFLTKLGDFFDKNGRLIDIISRFLDKIGRLLDKIGRLLDKLGDFFPENVWSHWLHWPYFGRNLAWKYFWQRHFSNGTFLPSNTWLVKKKNWSKSFCFASKLTENFFPGRPSDWSRLENKKKFCFHFIFSRRLSPFSIIFSFVSVFVFESNNQGQVPADFPVFLSFYMSVCLSICMSTSLYDNHSVCRPLCMLTSLYVNLSVCRSACMLICLSLCLSLSVCLFCCLFLLSSALHLCEVGRYQSLV